MTVLSWTRRGKTGGCGKCGTAGGGDLCQPSLLWTRLFTPTTSGVFLRAHRCVPAGTPSARAPGTSGRGAVPRPEEPVSCLRRGRRSCCRPQAVREGRANQLMPKSFLKVGSGFQVYVVVAPSARGVHYTKKEDFQMEMWAGMAPAGGPNSTCVLLPFFIYRSIV